MTVEVGGFIVFPFLFSWAFDNFMGLKRGGATAERWSVIRS